MSGGGRLPLAAGMQLSAEIIEDRRTVLEYLLSPVQRVLSEARRGGRDEPTPPLQDFLVEDRLIS